jgi:hypothetical protein
LGEERKREMAEEKHTPKEWDQIISQKRLQRRQDRSVKWKDRKEQITQQRIQRMDEINNKKGFINALLAPARLTLAACAPPYFFSLPPKRYGPHLTYKERKRIATMYRLEVSHQRLQKVFGPIKLYRPHYLKHPTENRIVTYRQWKYAQRIIIWREKQLYKHMKNEHSLMMRYMIWASQPGSLIENLVRVVATRIKQVMRKGKENNG